MPLTLAQMGRKWRLTSRSFLLPTKFHGGVFNWEHHLGDTSWRDHPWRNHPQAQIAETTPQARSGRKAQHGGLDVTLLPHKDLGQVQEKAVETNVDIEYDESSSSDTTRTDVPH